MKCGVDIAIEEESKNFQTNFVRNAVPDIKTVMAMSKQGKLASELKAFMFKHFAEEVKTPGLVKFVAKTWGIVRGKGFSPAKFGPDQEYGEATKLSYAYMYNIGMLPSSVSNLVDE